MTEQHDPFSYPPRGMDRVEAARYIGVSPTLFDRLIEAGKFPRPKRISDGRLVWDRIALDMAFGDLPERSGGTFEELLEKTRIRN